MRSINFDEGIYQFEFLQDKIAICKWDEPPNSTVQWVKVIKIDPDVRYFYFEGTCLEDIKVISNV